MPLWPLKRPSRPPPDEDTPRSRPSLRSPQRLRRRPVPMSPPTQIRTTRTLAGNPTTLGSRPSPSQVWSPLRIWDDGPMRTPRLLAGAILALGLVSLSVGAAVAQPSGPGPIDIVEVEGLIDPPMARFITDRLASADMDGAQLVILRLNSPAAVGIAEN